LPVLTILISGLISLTICVGSNSSGDGCNFIINFLLYFVTTLQIVLIVSMFFSIVLIVRSNTSSLVGPDVANRT
jgi:hypothetical protein